MSAPDLSGMIHPQPTLPDDQATPTMRAKLIVDGVTLSDELLDGIDPESAAERQAKIAAEHVSAGREVHLVLVDPDTGAVWADIVNTLEPQYGEPQ